MTQLEQFKEMMKNATGEKEEPTSFGDGTIGIRCYSYLRTEFVTFYFDKESGKLVEFQ